MENYQTPTKTSQQELISQPKRNSPDDAREKAISAAIAQLSLIYWRPDFTPQQFKFAIAAYLEDFRKLSVYQVEMACREYRRNPENKFFPTPGQLLDLTKDKFADTPSRLPRFEGYPALEGPRATKSVAQILEEHGFTGEAAKWKTT